MGVLRLRYKPQKQEGLKLGNPSLHLTRPSNTVKARLAHIEQAEARNVELRIVVNELIIEHGGALSLRKSAQRLNEAGYTTALGKKFHATSVKRLLTA